MKIGSTNFKERFRQKAEDFSRENRQKLSFRTVFTSLLHRMVKSLDVGVQELLAYLSDNPRIDCRKQSYSDARKKIKWEGYLELNQDFIGQYYSDKSELKKYKGMIMIGIDGSTLCLSNTPSLADYFGIWKNGGDCRPLARVSRAVDLLNLKVIDAQISGCLTSEMVLAKRHIPIVEHYLGSETTKLLLFDRNYPSYYWFGYMESLGNKYVARVKSDAGIFQQFANSEHLDMTVEVDINALNRDTRKKYLDESASLGKGVDFPKKFFIRLIKLPREGGESIILATNLLDEALYPYEDFDYIYHCRWGCETDYDKLKNVIQVENFSSITPLGILQEFHSASLMQNIASLVIENAQAELEAEIQEKAEVIEEPETAQLIKNHTNKNGNPDKRKVCFAVAFGLIRNEIWNLIFFDEPIEAITDRLIEKIKKRNHLVEPGRSFVRKKMRTKSRFPTVKRKVI